MKHANTRALVEAFYQSRLANSVEECLKHFAPGASLRIAGSQDASPIAASASDESSFRHKVSELVTTWEWRSLDVESITVEADRAVVHFRVTAAFKPTGDVVTSELVDLFSVKSGKIASIVEFLDTALAARLAEKLIR